MTEASDTESVQAREYVSYIIYYYFIIIILSNFAFKVNAIINIEFQKLTFEYSFCVASL